jgi:hypothetical protein
MSETNGLVDAAEFEPPAVYETSDNYDKYGAIAGSGNTPTRQSKFYDGNTKSVLGSWNYWVEFSEPLIFQGVQLYHILDVAIPTYNFKQNTVVYGSVPKSYVTFDSEKQYQFAITFEEDRFGTITALAYSFQRRILTQSGMYQSLLMQMLGDCIVSLTDQMVNRNIVMSWKMKDIRFLGIEDVSLSYTSSESMKLKMTFACDIVEYNNYSDVTSKAHTKMSAGALNDEATPLALGAIFGPPYDPAANRAARAEATAKAEKADAEAKAAEAKADADKKLQDANTASVQAAISSYGKADRSNRYGF